MNGDFDLVIEQATRLAVTRASGTWSHATVDRWQQAFDDMLANHRGLRLLVDLRGSATHPRDVGERLETMTAAYAQKLERVAIIFPLSALAALQTRRLGPSDARANDRERYFGPDEVDAAREWLTCS